jgi:hypothetical protein
MSMDPEILDYCAAQPSEETLQECSNGKDDDRNTFVDCNDFSCARSMDAEVIAYCDTKLERTVDRCTDGIDNDGNGYVDCGDFGCSGSSDPAVLQACQESYTDTPGGGEEDTKCSDGMDNDGDGFIDCEDWDCFYNPDVSVCADAVEICALPLIKGPPRP